MFVRTVLKEKNRLLIEPVFFFAIRVACKRIFCYN